MAAVDPADDGTAATLRHDYVADLTTSALSGARIAVLRAAGAVLVPVHRDPGTQFVGAGGGLCL
jgi:hypothetical protein